MKILLSLFAVTWLLSGCVSSTSHDDSPGANGRDAKTGLCDDARPPPCGGVKD
jgi:hypothetical protein